MGASQGIGASLAELLAANGAKKVILIARTKSKLDEVAALINAKYPGVAESFPTDCSEYSAAEKTAQSVLDTFGAPSILVNCAGAGAWRFLWEMDAEDIAGCMNAPYLAAAYMCKAFTMSMIKQNYGTIVNVQSPAAHIGWGGSTAYSCGRWALRGLTECLRADLSATSVKVQEVILGETKSEYFNNNTGSIERIPRIGRLARSLTSHQAAQGVVNAIISGKDTYVWPFMLHLMMWFHSWVPSLVSFLVIRTGWRFKPKKE